MSLTVGSNSWVTVAEADAYLGDRIGTSDWFDLGDTPINPGDDSKETMLTSAFFIIRSAVDFEIALSSEDSAVKEGQIEMALFLLNNYEEWEKRLTMRSLGIEDFSFADHSEKLVLDSSLIPINVKGKLASYYVGTGIAQLLGEDYIYE